jgi:dTDP-4-dehydrorhamnose 3,5-epimerase
MKFTPAKIPGVWIIEQERFADERGYFARTWCAEEFAAQGLNPRLIQCSTSFNLKRGTLRGLHFQAAPYSEDKLVRCTRGAIFDVAVDIRPDSPTYKQWVGMELSEANGLALYIPQGFAHGFQTLADNSEVFYQISHPYEPKSGRILHWNDSELMVRWPLPPSIISERDQKAPGLQTLTTAG